MSPFDGNFMNSPMFGLKRFCGGKGWYQEIVAPCCILLDSMNSNVFKLSCIHMENRWLYDIVGMTFLNACVHIV